MKNTKDLLERARIYWVYDKDLANDYDPEAEILAAHIQTGMIDVIQFRAKNLPYIKYKKWVFSLMKKIDFSKVLTFSNDHVEAVADLNLDGIHVGADDTPVFQVREMLGDDVLIGATARTLERALLADSQCADYLGVGTVFHTTTKQGLKAKGPAFIKEVQDQVNIPVFAIGGICSENISELLDLGINRVAIASNLLNMDNPHKELQNLYDGLNKLS
jgi:thiamine-phosphate pyrophosphorylase